MTLAAGPRYVPGAGFRPGWIEHDGARVVASGEGAPPRAPDREGWLLPAPVNAHTHVGDFVGRGRDLAGLSLKDVVAPPDGLKHRLLRETPEAQLLAGMRDALREIEGAGTRTFLDFREGGAAGVALLREAAKGRTLRPVVLARAPRPYTDEEAREALDRAEGYGHSGLADDAWDVAVRAAALARALGKRFALHFSEDQREDVGRALDLRPDLLVHGVRCTEEDIAQLAAARVPLVLCPRSNALFGPLPDVPAMLRAGVPLAVGSDNAMFHPLDVLMDVRVLCGRFPEVEPFRFLDACVLGGRLVADGRAPDDPWREGEATDAIVLDGDPVGQRAPRVLWRSWTKD